MKLRGIGVLVAVLIAMGFCCVAAGGNAANANMAYAQWENGPSTDPAYFPLAVWLQFPRNARTYRDLGINLYIGKYRGPSGQELDQLKEAGISVICTQNEESLKHIDHEAIVGWMQEDEPDQCRLLADYWDNSLQTIQDAWGPLPFADIQEWRASYGPHGAPIPPRWVQEDYERIKTRDPSRPVYLNLGTGVALDQLGGRGIRSRHPEDYYDYSKACDIVSYDTYPDRAGGARKGKLWYVARGVKRLYEYSGGEKIVWNIIEGSRSSATGNRPTPESLRSEAWMSIIHGSRGICYFVHLFQPQFVEAGVLGDTELMQGMRDLHREILALAPVINSPTLENAVSVRSSVPVTEPDMLSDDLQAIAAMAKSYNDDIYIFSIRMEGTPAQGEFRVNTNGSRVEVLGEGRTIPISNGRFTDRFDSYQVHLYKVSK